MPKPLPCIICQTLPLQDKFTMLHGALECRAYGNYGSTIYDPVDNRTYLRFNLCDNCMETLSAKGLVQEATVIPKPSAITYKRWAYNEVEDE
jgi:hypothetical protein